MKNFFYALFLLLAFPALVLGQTTSIYDIQFTTNPGNGTYPSPLEGQSVTTGGIVTAIDYNNKNYFISSSAGGAWNGLFIYDDDYSPAIGDSIVIQGQVYEYNGFTEIKSLSSFSIVSSGNLLPPAALISTHTVDSQEAYEGVFVETNDVIVSQAYNEWSEWKVNDGSGSCLISYGFINLEDSGFPIFLDYPFASIKGVVSYSYGGFKLHPRAINDLQSSPESFILSIGDYHIYVQDEFAVGVNLSVINQASTGTSYTLNLGYDTNIIEYIGFDQTNTLSQNGSINDQSSAGNISLAFTGDFDFNGIETLIHLIFIPASSGNTSLNISSSTLNGNPIEFTSSGSVTTTFNAISIGDTLTIIQRPIQNIPAIVVPGDEIPILCHALENTTDWEAQLEYKSVSVPLDISSLEFNNDLQIWTLHAIVPQIDFYELYNLKVTASDGIIDLTKNAVQIIPQIKSNFYFAHITDTHLPTHYFYEDPESFSDTSEMQDLREIIHDINILRPEFVLLTGDFVNEGELEDFENRRNHTKAQRILSEFEVPVFLLPGNHDLGGWDETPPPQGTSRNEWWRFFGWSWLKNPGNNNTYTQDYSFDYGPVHFTGLESYINYDGYMFSTYGNESFIPSQLQWLENDLANASDSETRVLFYHKDFDNQISLQSMNIDMALWGHIHSNSGSIYSSPYDLATTSTCDGNRAFRLINVNDSTLQPYETVYAGTSGESFTVDFFPANTGNHDSVTATITNNYNIDFYHALLKFQMPAGDYNYNVENGELVQVLTSEDITICYVSATIPANGNVEVKVIANSTAAISKSLRGVGFEVYQSYPNPFRNETSIRFKNQNTEHIQISIFDVSGKLIKTLLSEQTEPGFHSIVWDGKTNLGNILQAQIFFCELSTQKGFSKVIRLLKL